MNSLSLVSRLVSLLVISTVVLALAFASIRFTYLWLCDACIIPGFVGFAVYALKWSYLGPLMLVFSILMAMLALSFLQQNKHEKIVHPA